MHDERRMTRGSWLVLAFAVALICLSAAQVVYRLLLPTEGWNYSQGQTVEDFDTNTLIFTTNLIGSPSPIQENDRLRAIEGTNIDQVQTLGGPRFSDGWQPGQIVHYTVLRNGQTLELAVPLKRWTFASIGAYVFRDFSSAIGIFTSVLMFGIGLFVMLRRPREWAARALCLFGAVFLANWVSGSIVPSGPTTQFSAIFMLSALLTNWIFGILVGPTLFVLALTFPQPKRVLRRLPWLVFLPYTVFWLLIAMFGWLPQIGWGLMGFFLLLSLAASIHSAFTQRDAVSRAQLRWGLGGLLAAILLFLPDIWVVVGAIQGTYVAWLFTLTAFLGSMAFPVFVGCLTVAILRYRLFDIDIIIRRTLVYSILTVTLGLVYVGCILLSRALIAQFTGTSEPAIVVSTLVIAALFFPLRRRIQNTIDRRFYRRKYDAQQVLAQFALTARDETDLQRLTDELLRVVNTTVQPEFAGVWLREPGHAAASQTTTPPSRS